jgi:hypothetical protein
MNEATGGRRVVVTGLGVVTSIGHDVPTYWASLLAGKIGIERVTLFDPAPYACQIGAEVRNWDVNHLMDPKEVRRNDRYTHFGFVAAKQAVADSGLDMAKEDGDRVGVIIGSGIGGMYTFENQLRVLAERGPRKVSPFTIPSLIGNMCAGLVAIEYGARGPNFGIVSACATGTHALGEAAHAIRRGDADVMFAGGSEAAITARQPALRQGPRRLHHGGGRRCPGPRVLRARPGPRGADLLRTGRLRRHLRRLPHHVPRPGGQGPLHGDEAGPGERRGADRVGRLRKRPRHLDPLQRQV